jgi:hypothetical protein
LRRENRYLSRSSIYLTAWKKRKKASSGQKSTGLRLSLPQRVRRRLLPRLCDHAAWQD